MQRPVLAEPLVIDSQQDSSSSSTHLREADSPETVDYSSSASQAPKTIPKQPPAAPKPKQFGRLDPDFHKWTEEELAAFQGAAKPTIEVARTRRFCDQHGKNWDISPPVASGTYLSVHNIHGDPERVFKRFSSPRAKESGKHLGSFANSKDAQYQKLVNVGISVAHTSPLKGGWRQSRMPHLVQDLITWDQDTPVALDEETGLLTGLHPVAAQVLAQVKETLRIAWEKRIDIDPLPGNFGYTLLMGNIPQVYLFDFREDSDTSFAENPLGTYLDGDHQCLAKFSRGNQVVRDYLDPRGPTTTSASTPAT